MSEQLEITGRFFGPSPTETERESGTAIEEREFGPLRQGSAGHRVLAQYNLVIHMTSYAASYLASGDYHAMRRESTRLLVRGLLEKDGVLPNPAPRGRPHVDAYRITPRGRLELKVLGDV